MLGTHSHGHAPLSRLGEGIARDEIGQSLDILEEVTGVRVRGISYPYGGATAVDETVAQVAADFGLAYGLTMRNGINGAAELAQPMLLARIDTNEVPVFLGDKVSDA
jgi:peptidoglycan/xylan/chitin deacetylase (PgdA/CDA1 family)